MNILRISGDIFPYVIGGMPLHVHEMAKDQGSLGIINHVFTSSTCKKTDIRYYHNFWLYSFPTNFNLFGNSFSSNLIGWIISNNANFDLIHLHSHLYFSSIISTILKNKRTSPMILTNHGLYSASTPFWFSNYYNYFLGKYIMNKVDVIICYNDVEKQKLINLGIKSNITVIPNGVDTNLFHPVVQKENILLWVGRFISGKGLKYLIEAFSIILKRYPDFKLYLIGSGPEKPIIMNYVIQLNLVNNVIMMDYIPNNQLPHLYSKSKLFLLPSFTEGIPRTLLEAMSTGVPVICTDLPQLYKLVEDCGLLVPVKNSKKLAEAIIYLLDNENELKTLGLNARNNVIKNYSWEKTVYKTIELYKNILK